MKKYLSYFLVPVFAIAGALVFLNLFAHVDFHIEALNVNLSVHTSYRGGTVLKVPPVGEIKAQTHHMPLQIDVALQNIDLDKLKDILAAGPEQTQLVAKAKVVVLREVRKFFLLVLLIGFAGGVFGLLIFQRTRLLQLLAGGLIGSLTVAVLLFGTYYTYDYNKFNNPQYEGMIKMAPWMIGLVQNGLMTVNNLGREMRGIATNLNDLFNRVASMQAMAPTSGESTILHVTDIHNNPVAFQFIDQVVKTFGVSFVIDSGDISDFGSPLESAMTERLKSLSVPYVFIPGNHETPSIIKVLKGTPNVLVLDGGVTKIKGFTIAGIRDPASESNDFHIVNQAKTEAFKEKLQDIIKQSGTKPDIVVAHNPKIAQAFWGRVPVVLSGHDHAYKIKVKPDSVFIDAGTSGASGIGGLRTKAEIPYTFVLLHFSKVNGEMRLKYTDTIRISNLQAGYSLERKVYPTLNKKPLEI